MSYIPKQGDIVFLDFDPQAGHEQKGRRPALIVSNTQFHGRTNLAIVCPITNTKRPFPLHVALDERSVTTGVILCEQIKSLDLKARNAEFREILPCDVLQDVLERVFLSVDFD